MILSPSYNVHCGIKPHRKLTHGPTSGLQADNELPQWWTSGYLCAITLSWKVL